MNKLGDYIDIKTGKRDANEACSNGCYPFFTCAKEPSRIDFWSFDCECVLVAGNCNPHVSYYNGKFNAYQRVYVIQSRDKKLLNIKYLYYFLKKYMTLVLDKQRGAIEKFFCLDDFTDIKIHLPDLPTQLRIAAILGSIDEKIELNRKKIAELEALAKTIYDYWFVQFDFPDKNGKPYKSSGGKMTWNEQLKREIPDGWEIGNLYDIANFENGLACQKFRPKDNEASLPVIKIREMHDGINSDTERVSINIPEKHRITDGDLLFSWSASLEAMIWSGGVGGLNQHIFKVTPRGEYTVEYVYWQLKTYIVTFAKMAEARKTTMGHITADHIKQSRVILPISEILSHFATIIRPIFGNRINLKKEIRMLVEQRDTLLPLLMNGQVEVK